MEQKFIMAWEDCRKNAASAGVKMRPIAAEDAMKTAHRCLTGTRPSDGFNALEKLGHLEWSLEALAVDKRFTALFSDEEANEALARLMEANFYKF